MFVSYQCKIMENKFRERHSSEGSSNMEIETVSSSVPDRRKSLKPIMEKKRRARINASLTELKTFLLDIIKKEGLRHNKMEKADILELTVKHLRQIQHNKNTGDYPGKDTFINGFRECANLVSSFLQTNSELDSALQTRLLDHLSRCSNDIVSNHTRLTNSPVTQIYTKQNYPELLPTRCNNSNSNIGVKNQSNESQTFGSVSANSAQTSIISGNACIKNSQLTDCRIAPPTFKVDLQPETYSGNVSTPVEKINQATYPVQTIIPTSNYLSNTAMGGISLVPVYLPSGEMSCFIPVNLVTNNCLPKYCLAVPSPNTDQVKSVDSFKSTTSTCVNNVRESSSERFSFCQDTQSNYQISNGDNGNRSSSCSEKLNLPTSTSSTLKRSSVPTTNRNELSTNTQRSPDQNFQLLEGYNNSEDLVWRPW